MVLEFVSDFPNRLSHAKKSRRILITPKKPKITHILKKPKKSCLELLMIENFPDSYNRKGIKELKFLMSFEMNQLIIDSNAF